MKTLLILRHAKSRWDDESLDDHERPLNRRGQRDAPQMGEWMRQQRLTPEAILSSDAVRARLTAAAVADAGGYTREIVFDERLYLASPDDIIAVLREADTRAESVMVVAHNPGLEELVAQLTGEQHELPTAALAQIVLPITLWRELDKSTRGRLAGLWRPKEL